MIILGIVLLVLDYLLHVSILRMLGIILPVVGVVLYLLDGAGRPVADRRHCR